MIYNKIFKNMNVLQAGDHPVDWGKYNDLPYLVFYDWLENALSIGAIEPHAMTLSTSDCKNVFSRVLLVRHVDEKSNFYFSTSCKNPTGQQIEKNPNVSLNFYIKETNQQIIVSGKVVLCSTEDSTQDFLSRSLGSKSICIAKKQSEPLDSLETMHEVSEKNLLLLEKDNTLVNEDWTLFKVIPNRIEFFQGRKTRQHERLLYERQKDDSFSKTFIWA